MSFEDEDINYTDAEASEVDETLKQEEQQQEEDTPIEFLRDTSYIVEKAQDFLQRDIADLDISQQQFNYKEGNKWLELSFKDFLTHCYNRYDLLCHGEVAWNLYNQFAQEINNRTLKIKSSIENNFRDLVREIDNMNQYLSKYEKEITKLNNVIEQKNEVIQQMKEKETQDLKQELELVKSFLHKNFGKDVVDNNENINTYSSLDKENQNVEPKQTSDDTSETQNTNIVDVNSDNVVPNNTDKAEDSMSDKIQKLHTEILTEMSEKEPTLYPPHKVDIDDALSFYNTAWEFKCDNFGLKPEHTPEFMFHLHAYKDKPKNYLDVVKEVDELWH